MAGIDLAENLLRLAESALVCVLADSVAGSVVRRKLAAEISDDVVAGMRRLYGRISYDCYRRKKIKEEEEDRRRNWLDSFLLLLMPLNNLFSLSRCSICVQWRAAYNFSEVSVCHGESPR